MMSAAPPFMLTPDQAQRLQAYIQTYRQHALTALLPSATRNTTLRVLQTLQGKLIVALEQQSVTRLSLLLTREEITTLQAVVTELVTLYAGQPESAARLAILSDLAGLKGCLKRYEG